MRRISTGQGRGLHAYYRGPTANCEAPRSGPLDQHAASMPAGASRWRSRGDLPVELRCGHAWPSTCPVSACCPDHNKVESVWKDLHDNVTRYHTYRNRWELKSEVNTYLNLRLPPLRQAVSRSLDFRGLGGAILSALMTRCSKDARSAPTERLYASGADPCAHDAFGSGRTVCAAAPSPLDCRAYLPHVERHGQSARHALSFLDAASAL